MRKFLLILLVLFLVSSGQIATDTVSNASAKNIDTPNGGTDLGAAIQKAHAIEAEEELMRQKEDSGRIANETPN